MTVRKLAITLTLLFLTGTASFAATTPFSQSPFILALRALQHGDVVLARQEFKKAYTDDPKDLEALLGVAGCDWVAKKKTDALKELDELIKRDPTITRARKLRSNILFRDGRLEEGLQDALYAVEHNATDVLGWTETNTFDDCAVALRKLGRYDESYKFARQARELKDLKNAYESILRSDASRGLNFLDRFIARNPHNYQGREYRGQALLYLGKTDQAIKDFSECITATPSFKTALYWRGEAYMQLGRYRLAMEDFDKIIASKPRLVAVVDPKQQAELSSRKLKHRYDLITLPDVYVDRGIVKRELGHTAEAIADLSQAVQMNPEDEVALQSRMLTYQKSGNLDLAIKDAARCVELQPDNWAFLSTYESLLEKAHRYDEALAALTKATTVFKNQPGAFINRGRLCERLNKPQPALADYATAIALAPNDDEPYFLRAKLQSKLGNYAKALGDIDMAIEYGKGDKAEYIALKKECTVKLGATTAKSPSIGTD